MKKSSLAAGMAGHCSCSWLACTPAPPAAGSRPCCPARSACWWHHTRCPPRAPGCAGAMGKPALRAHSTWKERGQAPAAQRRVTPLELLQTQHMALPKLKGLSVSTPVMASQWGPGWMPRPGCHIASSCRRGRVSQAKAWCTQQTRTL